MADTEPAKVEDGQSPSQNKKCIPGKAQPLQQNIRLI
jgi:hypothetical protein